MWARLKRFRTPAILFNPFGPPITSLPVGSRPDLLHAFESLQAICEALNTRANFQNEVTPTISSTDSTGARPPVSRRTHAAEISNIRPGWSRTGSLPAKTSKYTKSEPIQTNT